MSNYLQIPANEFVPIVNSQVLKRTLEIFATPLANNCTLAGGYVRALCRGDSIPDYLGNDSKNPMNKGGDIDVFLPGSGEDLLTTVGENLFQNTIRSHAGFAWNRSGHWRALGSDCDAEIQFIDYPAFCSPDPAKVIDRFDFTNIAIGLSLVNGEPTITVHKRWREVEDSNLLDVRNSSSPFLGNRINKYLKRRGYDGVTPDSKRHITEWLAKCAANEKFYTGDQELKFTEMLKNGVIALFERGVASKDDVVMFLGKWEIQVTTKGQDYTLTSSTVDWALNHISNANKERAATL